MRSKQWHLDAMKAEEMWKTSTGQGVTVAVIDTGVDATNPDLAGQVLKGLNLERTVPGDELDDYNGHGTGMAGLIAGTGKSRRRETGLSDSLPEQRFFRFGYLRPPRPQIRLRLTGSSTSAPTAIRYAADHGAKVVNISLGHYDRIAAVD